MIPGLGVTTPGLPVPSWVNQQPGNQKPGLPAPFAVCSGCKQSVPASQHGYPRRQSPKLGTGHGVRSYSFLRANGTHVWGMKGHLPNVLPNEDSRALSLLCLAGERVSCWHRTSSCAHVCLCVHMCVCASVRVCAPQGSRAEQAERTAPQLGVCQGAVPGLTPHTLAWPSSSS